MEKTRTEVNNRSHFRLGVFLVSTIIISIASGSAQAQETVILGFEESVTTLQLTASEQAFVDSAMRDEKYESVRLFSFDNAASALTDFDFRVGIGGDLHEFHTVGFTRKPNGITWVGTIDDGRERYTLAVADGYLAGNLRIGADRLTLQPVGVGVSLLTKRDPNFVGPTDGYPRTGTETRSSVASKVQSSTTHLDLLVVYTQAAATGISSIINAAEQDFASALDESNTDVTVSVVHSAQVTYTESGSLATDAERLVATSDGYMDGVHDLRDEYGADAVVLIVNSSTDYLNGYAYDLPATAEQAFAVVVKGDVVDTYLIPHEVGHLMGARHNYAHAYCPCPPPNYAFGYYVGGDETIMSIWYGGTAAYRIRYFSNPNKFVNGHYIGSSTADNARLWDEEIGNFSAFRDSSGGPLSTTITGLSRLSWKQKDTLRANTVGGTGSFGYQWWWQVGGTSQWIDPNVSTEYLVYEMVWEDGVTWKAEVSSGNSLTAEDTHWVSYIGGGAKNHPGQPDVSIVSDQALLFQNYPNPISETGTITFFLPAYSGVRLDLYDALGRYIMRLADGFRSKGEHYARFDVSGLPSGLYSYRLESPRGIQTRTMTVIR